MICWFIHIFGHPNVVKFGYHENASLALRNLYLTKFNTGNRTLWLRNLITYNSLTIVSKYYFRGSDATGCRFSDLPKIWSSTYSYFGGCSNKLTSKLCYINFCVVSQLTLFSRVVSFLFCDALTSRRQGQPVAESTMAPGMHLPRETEWTSAGSLNFLCSCCHMPVSNCVIHACCWTIAYSRATSYSIGNRFFRWQIEYCVNINNKNN